MRPCIHPSCGLLSGNMLRTSETYPLNVYRAHFSSLCVYFFYIALHNKWILIYVSTWDVSCIFLVTFCDSFAFLFKINYCFVLVLVPLEDELEAVFPSSSFFSLLIFKVARLVPRWILGASLARKVAIHNCLLLFDFFMAVQHLPIATSTLASNAWPSTYSFVLLHTEVFLKVLINPVYGFFPPMCLVLLLW